MAKQKPMELYQGFSTGKTNSIIEDLQKEIDDTLRAGGEINPSRLLMAACNLATKNVNKNGRGSISFDNIEGGPFAGIIVEYPEGFDDKGNPKGRPVVIGVGANHVVPTNDPSAHGEMSAIRDASYRRGNSDFRNAVMFTSSECCPQCQAACVGVGIKRIYFANTCDMAADIGFSDAEQYRNIQEMPKFMKGIEAFPFDRQEQISNALGNYGAVVLAPDGTVYATSYSKDESPDPMDSLASMRAIRAACNKAGSFHLPEGYTLVTKQKPHPVAFTTADWARIGRKRDPNFPESPEKDTKTNEGIIYINDTREEMMVKNASGESSVVRKATDIEAELKKPLKERSLVPTERVTSALLDPVASSAFNLWKALTGQFTQLQY